MKIIVDPFTKLTFEIEIVAVNEGQYRAEGFLMDKNHPREPLSKATKIEPGRPPKVQRGPLLQQLASDIDFAWLQRVFPHPAILGEEELYKWHEEWKEEGEGAPKILFPHLTEKKPEVWPILKLKDRFGAFADLWLDYVGKKEVAFHEARSSHFRDPSVEKAWEKDLLETGFQPKKVDSSHYYCPMDKVTSSLSFLLDIGWIIFDYQGKKLVRQTKADVKIEEQLFHLVMKGKLVFGEHVVDLKDVAQACVKNERFMSLSESSVALIDEEALPSKLTEFSQEGGALKLSKSRFAIFKEEEYPRSLQEILSLAQGKTSQEPVHVSDRFCGKLHPYQLQGLQWLNFLKKQNLAGLLADEMGLGKTVQVLSFLASMQEQLPILIVVPTSLLFHWKKESERFLQDFPLYVHNGADRKASLENETAILTSYALLRQDQELFAKGKYCCVILDEAQTIKNPESQIAEVVCSLKADFRLAITGTPVENRSEDLWSIFRFLLPELLGNKTAFRSRMNEYNKKLISPFLMRRKKEVVAHQLPEKLEQIVWVEMEEEQRNLYDSILAASRKQIGGATNRLQILEKILRLRQICCHPALINEGRIPSAKLERLILDLEEIAAEGRKALIYSQFTSMLSLIKQVLLEKNYNFSYLDGATDDRQEAVAKFQGDPNTSFFLISLKAGGVGLNLTKADYVLLFDPWWNEAVERQAIDRAHRLGRESLVIARRYVTALSIEEKMMHLKEHKKKLMGDLLENVEDCDLSIENLLFLLS
jgi:superfamily II DNA or RNA helicase